MNDSEDLSWHEVTALSDLFDGAGLEFEVSGRIVALFRVGDAVHATAPMCTHGRARLCEGFIEDGSIECPLHQGRFDLKTGAPMCAPVTEALVIHPARVEAGRIWVALRP